MKLPGVHVPPYSSNELIIRPISVAAATTRRAVSARRSFGIRTAGAEIPIEAITVLSRSRIGADTQHTPRRGVQAIVIT